MRDADLVILCTPVGACGADCAGDGAGACKPGAILTDVGSVKGAVLRDVGPFVPDGRAFHSRAIRSPAPSIPGPNAGLRRAVRRPLVRSDAAEGADPAAVDKLDRVLAGAAEVHVEIMDAEHHDLVLAITSHVPHLIAYNIVNTARHLERVTDTEVIKFSAGGFRDFTRIAASDPIMWRDVFLNNKEAVLEMLGRFSEDLTALQRAIRFGDGDTLYQLFVEARATRRSIIEAGQDTAAPDFGRHAGGKPSGT